MSKTVQLPPLAIGTYDIGWGSVGTGPTPPADNKASIVHPGDPVPTHDDATSYMNAGFQSPVGLSVARSFTLKNVPNDVLTVTSVTVRMRHRGQNHYTDLRGFVIVGGSTYNTDATTRTTVGGWGVDASDLVTRSWLASEINSLLEVGVYVWAFEATGSDAIAEVTSLWLQLIYGPVPANIGSGRDSGTRRVWALRGGSPILTLETPRLDEALDLEILDPLPVSNQFAPHDAGAGWQEKTWERRLMTGLEESIDLNSMLVTWKLRDKRPFLVLYRDTAWSKISANPWAEGVGRISNDVTRTFTRGTPAWVNDPADEVVVRVEEDQEAFASGGELHEEARNNYLNDSSWINGLSSGWTESGDGTASLDTGTLLFNAEVSPNSLKMTADAVIATDFAMTADVTAALAANDDVRVSLDCIDADAAEPGMWLLQRDSDSEYYTDSSGTWGAALAWNSLAGSLTWTRFKSKTIDVGAGTPALTLKLGVSAAAGVANQVNNFGHAQIEKGTFVTSRIVSELPAGGYTRATSRLLVTNNTGDRTVWGPQGSFACEVIPGWSEADLPSGATPTVSYAWHDASNWLKLYYSEANSRWQFEHRAAGTTVTSFIAASPVDGTTYRLCVVWTGSNGENDKTAFTVSVFLDAVLGTEVTAAAAITEAASANLEIGSDGAGTSVFNGQIRQIHSFQYIPTDAEAARMPPQ